MAHPDLDDGYLRIAHELFAAICCAGFGKWEMMVLREVFDQTYGPLKTKTAKLSPSQIARQAGTSAQVVNRAIQGLIASGVLVAETSPGHGTPGEYRFVKDYSLWTRKGEPRISEAESAICLDSRRSNCNQSISARAYRPAKAISFCAYRSTKPVSAEASNDLVQPSAGAYSYKRGRLDLEAPALIDPLKEPARDLRIKKEEKESLSQDKTNNFEINHQINQEPSGGSLPHGPVPDYPVPETSPLMIAPGKAEECEDDARVIWSLVWHAWGDFRLCREFYEHQRWYHATQWRGAIRDLVRRNQKPHSIRLVEIFAEKIDPNAKESDGPNETQRNGTPQKRWGYQGSTVEQQQRLGKRLAEIAAKRRENDERNKSNGRRL